MILLEGVRTALPDADAYGGKPPPELAPGHPAGAIFGLVLGSGRVVALVAGSASERTQWIGAIEQTCRPAARIETLADCGHWLHAEDPARFNALVRAFLDDRMEAAA